MMIKKRQLPQIMTYKAPSLQKPTSIQHLPNEILAKIIQLLPQKDIYQSILVCDSWYNLALPVYYNDIVIDKNKFKRIISPRDLHLKSHGHWIRSVTIKGEDMGTLSMKFLRDLFIIAPHLQTIDISHSSEAKNLFNAFKNSSATNMLPYLENINIHTDYQFDALKNYSPKGWEFNDDYISTCYKFRASIKHLKIHDINPIIKFTRGLTNPLNYLNNFPQLTHLTISSNLVERILTRTPLNEIETIKYVLKHCKNLKSFKFLNYYNMFEFAYKFRDKRSDLRNLLDNITRVDLIQEIDDTQRHTNILGITQQIGMLIPYISMAEEAMNTDYTLINEQPKQLTTQLKHFTYVSSVLSKEQVDYVSNNIPLNNLQTFAVAIDRYSVVEWFNNIGFDNAFKFAQCLSQVKHLQLKFTHKAKLKTPTNRQIAGPIYSPIQEMWTRTLFWTFLEKIRGSRDLSYSINLDVSPKTILFDPETRVQLKEKEKTIYLDQAITLNSFLYIDYVQHDQPHPFPEEVLPPHDLFYPQVVDRTKQLTLNLPTSNCLREMTTVLEIFKQLNTLVIRATNRLGEHDNTGSSIDCQSDTPSSSKLTQATLTRMHLTPKFTASFVYGFPHLTTLSLVNCDFFDAAGWISKQPILDLTRLKHLQKLALTIQPDTSSYSSVLVCIHHYFEKKSKPHCKRRYLVTSDASKHLREGDPTVMTLVIRAGDALTMITFGKSDERPRDAILD